MLLAIAIPAVSKILDRSRRRIYIETADAYAIATSMKVNLGTCGELKDEEALYYIPINCIKTEKGKSDYEFAFIIVTYDGFKNNYYHYFKDLDGLGLLGTRKEKITISDLKAIDKKKNEYIFLENKTKILLLGNNCGNNFNLVENPL